MQLQGVVLPDFWEFTTFEHWKCFSSEEAKHLPLIRAQHSNCRLPVLLAFKPGLQERRRSNRSDRTIRIGLMEIGTKP